MNNLLENEKTAVVVDNQRITMGVPFRKGISEVVDLQLKLVSSSMNHEYTRKEFEKTDSYDKRQFLLVKMSQWKDLYFSARDRLALAAPERLEEIEKELFLEKQTVLADQSIH